MENISTDMTEDNDTAPADGESWTSPFGVERDKRMSELQAMPGFQLKLDLEALGRAEHAGSVAFLPSFRLLSGPRFGVVGVCQPI